jgi:outer membrane protein assembly factor BamB
MLTSRHPTSRVFAGIVCLATIACGCERSAPQGELDAATDAATDDADSADDGSTDATTDASMDAATDASDDADTATDAATDDADTDADDPSDAEPPEANCLALFEGLPSELERLMPIGPDVRGAFFTASSPRAFDVDRDGCKDFVFGSGLEFVSGRVMAVSGASGELLWTTTTHGDIFTSPVFRVLPNGRVQIVIGGRDGTLVAIDGETGAPLWETDANEFGARDVHFNFYTPQWIEDVNEDGAADLLVVHGGDALAPPGEPRDPSWVAIVDGANGHVLARRLTPDLGESYTSPVILRSAVESPSTGSVFIFGTGGETLPGSLFLGTVVELLAPTTDELWGRELTKGSSGKGVIAPTAIADLDGDGELDLAVVDFGGRVSLLVGPDFSEAWHVDFEGEEAYATAAPLRRNDGSYAIAVSHNLGAFPSYTKTTHRLLRAVDGALLESFESPLPFSPSPLAVDLDGDGSDELIAAASSIMAEPLTTELLVFDLEREALELFELPFAMFATPLVHVAEGHDQLELVFAGFQATGPWPSPLDYLMRRVALGATRPASVTWGAYMGNCGTGRADCSAD